MQREMGSVKFIGHLLTSSQIKVCSEFRSLKRPQKYVTTTGRTHFVIYSGLSIMNTSIVSKLNHTKNVTKFVGKLSFLHKKLAASIILHSIMYNLNDRSFT